MEHQHACPRPVRDRTRLTLALLLSLLIHILLLRLTFDGQSWVRGFGFPWQLRTFDVAALRVVLVPPVSTVHTEAAPLAAPRQQAIVDQPVVGNAALTPSEPRAPTPGTFAAGIVGGTSESTSIKPKTDPEPAKDAKPRTLPKPRAGVQSSKRQSRANVVAGAVTAKPDLRPDRSDDAVMPPVSPPDVIALDRSEDVTWTVPPGVEREAPEKTVDLAKQKAFPPTDQHQEAAQQDPIRDEAADFENARLEVEREQAARQAVAEQEAQRQGAERQVAAQQEAERQVAERQIAAQKDAERQEAARQEAARAENAQLEAEREQAARQALAEQEALRQEAARQAAVRAEVARLEAEREEASRQAALRQEIERQEIERREAQRREAAQQVATQQEAARAETARLEAERQEAERQAAAQQEAQRQEAARQEAARAEAARLEAERQDAARQLAAQQEGQRQAAAQQEAQRQEAARQYEAKREERLRAIGRQLDEEAAQRTAASNAARVPNSLPLSLSTARRIKLWGRYHVNVELVRYAEAWARKIQFNTPLETVREIAKRPHTAPMVTVAFRSDGSVESVTIEVSSGVAQVDDALRRIVEDRRPYQPFQPELARDFDVIEIRRTWHFGSAVQLD